MNAFGSIIQLLGSRLERQSSAVLVGSHGRIPLRPEYFSEIVPSSGGVVFVDSGSGEILFGPNVCVSFIRTCVLEYEKNVRVARSVSEYFLSVIAVKRNLDLGFQVDLFSKEGALLRSFEFDAQDPAFALSGLRADPLAVVSAVRKFLEFELVGDALSKLSKGGVVVRDGDLDARGALLESARLSLRTAALSKGVAVIGLSKTSRLCTDSGDSAVVAVRSIAKDGSWLYFAGGEVGFVKLHRLSKYVFRFDAFAEKDAVKAAAGVLALNSSDPAFLGYPYGLLDADKTAQVTKAELAELRLRFAVQSGEKFKVFESAIDAHGILDAL